MLARFELFNDQSFYQNNRQDLCSYFCYSLNPDVLFLLSSAQYTYLIFLLFRHSLPKWHKTNALIRGILTALYTLKFTRDPLINRSILCKNPRILQGDFQLYKYNIDLMEKNSAFSKVFISFHYIYPRLRRKSVLAFLMYEHCFLNQIKLSFYPNFYQ
jgi:hypothetical protein